MLKNRILLLSFSLLLPSLAVSKTESKNQLLNPQGKAVTLRMSLTREQHTKGLSGLKPKDFGSNEGMLFVNGEVAPRQFWMPDTYFNLDIIFLGPNLEVVGIEKNVPHHPGEKEPPPIYRTKTYLAKYILETKSPSTFSKSLKVGDVLKWKGTSSLSEIESNIHLAR